MSRPRICPHCFQLIPATSGFHFDADLNMIHDSCGKVVVSVTAEADNQFVKTYYTKPTHQTTHQTSYGYHSQVNQNTKPYNSGWEE